MWKFSFVVYDSSGDRQSLWSGIVQLGGGPGGDILAIKRSDGLVMCSDCYSAAGIPASYSKVWGTLMTAVVDGGTWGIDVIEWSSAEFGWCTYHCYNGLPWSAWHECWWIPGWHWYWYARVRTFWHDVMLFQLILGAGFFHCWHNSN